LLRVCNRKLEADNGLPSFGFNLRAGDVYPNRRDSLSYGGQQAELVLGVNRNANTPRRANAGIPLDIDLSHHIAAQDERTLSVMNGHTSSSGDEPDDSIARKGLTTFREANQDVIEARDPHTDPVSAYRGRALEDTLQRRWLRL
jgi:hypothetical protein